MRGAITALVVAFLLSTDAWCSLTVILVRHAEVAEQAGPDPPLSPQGQSRAKLLASMLRNAHVDAIYISAFRRTQQTAQPSADLFHLQPERLEGANAAALLDPTGRSASRTVLVVGHSDTIPELISKLGGPLVRIAGTEFDNLFIVAASAERTSLLQLRYGNESQPLNGQVVSILSDRSPVMEISFVRSGGFAGRIRKVGGTVTLHDDGASVSSDSSAYHRALTSDEATQLRAGADPAELVQAATQIAARTKGAADLDHYHITVKTKDGKTQDVDLNTSGSSSEMQGVSPSVVKLLRWLQEEAQKISSSRVAGQ